MKMTRADYLVKRGWSTRDIDGGWSNGNGMSYSLEVAVSVQLARDAEEERRAWDTAWDAALTIGLSMMPGNSYLREGVANDAALIADAKLKERRTRFAVEFTD